ncbi:hypothetical protein [Streptomyces sp. NRRL S-350]|uniref:hypothetical protein n=1 Tax=Streptomyces sp. NRRL S-350 TaxID=1463902 RepID=UPI0004C1F464|nr:hypothetical protein [Streptomyces sp. NRRL S-350]
MRRRYHLPDTVTGEVAAADRERLLAVVRSAVQRALAAAGPGEVVAPRPGEPARERYSQERRTPEGGYAVPSYDEQGRPVGVPLLPAAGGAAERLGAPPDRTGTGPVLPVPEPPAEAGSAGTATWSVAPLSASAATTDEGAALGADRSAVTAGPGTAPIVRLIRERWPAAGFADPAGVRYGVYTAGAGESTPRLFYLAPDSEGPVLRALRLAVRAPGTPRVVDLPGGDYTVVARPHSAAQLYRGPRRLSDLGNPQDLDLTVNFTAVSDVPEVTVRATPRYHLWPRPRILRVDQQDGAAVVGADTTYLAEVEIWRLEESGRWTPVYELALVYAFISYRWRVYRIEHDRHGERYRVPVDTGQSTRASFTHRFDRAGEFEVECEVRLSYEDASPEPVTERRTDRAQRLEERMALELAGLEKATRAAGAEPVWSTSADELLTAARQRLRRAEQATPRDEPLIRELRDSVAALEKRLVGTTGAGPFPLRALFTDRRTAHSRPISLFVGPAPDSAGPGHTWLLIDVTYPAFHRTYRGTGPTAEAALRAAFEEARTSFRGSYPPGRILARIEWPGMARLQLKPFDFATDTESWQRTAWEWLSVVATGLAVAGTALALAFPVSSPVAVGVIVLAGALTGGVLSAVNLAERLHHDAFEWDRETALDLLAVATAFTSVGGAVARRAIAAGAPLTIEATARLAGILKFQRAVLYVDLGAHLTDAVLLSYDTYLQLRDVDAAMSDTALARLQREYGDEEGRRRFEAERFTRILGVLARAAVNGLLTVVAVRGTAKAVAAGRSVRLAAERGGTVLQQFPEADFRKDPGGFRRRQSDEAARRLGLTTDPGGAASAQALSARSAWGINKALASLSEDRRALVLATMRPGGADLKALRSFLADGGSLTELAAFLETQPVWLRNRITTFGTLQTRAEAFNRLSTTVPDIAAFRWNQENLTDHFGRHVLGRAGYPDEAWKWAERLGIARAYGFDRTRYQSLLRSTTAADGRLRWEITERFRQAYGDYVHRVMTRTAVFGRTGKGAELVGSDGELFWAAAPTGLISTGYFPDNPTTWPPSSDELVRKLGAALSQGQSVVQLYRLPR